MSNEENLVEEQQDASLSQDQLDALVALHERFLQGRIGGRRANIKHKDLSGLRISGHDLRQSDFSGCQMRGMDLSGTNFQEATLYACDLSFADLNNTTFIRADMRGCRIESANLVGADLERADLRGGALTKDGSYAQPQPVNFRGADLSGAHFVGTMANNADFSDAIMARINVQKADLRGARLNGADLTGADLSGTQLAGAQLNNTILTGTNIKMIKDKGYDISGAITDENIGPSVSELVTPLIKLIEEHQSWVSSSGKEGRQLDLSDYDLREIGSLKMEKLTALRARRAKFFGMNLFKVELQSSYLEEADFRRCDLEEADFRGSNLTRAKFSHAKLSRSNFSPLLFTGGEANRFAPCDLSWAEFRYANLSEARLKGANLQYADLSYANLGGCDLRDCDFTGAKLEGALMDNADTKGAIFDQGPKGSAFSLSSLKEDEEDL